METSERAMSLDIENHLSMKTRSAKAFLRPASASSRGWGCSDKNSDSRRTREARSLRFALFRLVVWNAIRRNAAKQSKQPYVDYLNNVEQTADGSLEWGSCYWDHPRDSLDHWRDELDDIASFGKKSRFGQISGVRTRMRCRASSFTWTLLVYANSEHLAQGEKPLQGRGHDRKLRRR